MAAIAAGAMREGNTPSSPLCYPAPPSVRLLRPPPSRPAWSAGIRPHRARNKLRGVEDVDQGMHQGALRQTNAGGVVLMGILGRRGAGLAGREHERGGRWRAPARIRESSREGEIGRGAKGRGRALRGQTRRHRRWRRSEREGQRSERKGRRQRAQTDRESYGCVGDKPVPRKR
jgi:hypothetical protein